MRVTQIRLPFKIKSPVLAFGPQTKNTVCFAVGSSAYMSPAHRDLIDPGEFLRFQKSIKYFLKMKPRAAAYDLHPEYQSTKYALGLDAARLALCAIQHHHAHIASCMVDNGLKNQRIIGVAFDGTGLGSDSRLWGAEFLICDYRGFKRMAHLKEVPLAGGEQAISEPLRVAAYWLYLIYKDKILGSGLDLVKKIGKDRWSVLKNMYLSGFNSPKASSMGRLFDAAASIIMGKARSKFEAELAIELEKKAAEYRFRGSGYSFEIKKENGVYLIDPLGVFRQIVLDIKAKEPPDKVAYRFHISVAEMLRKTCLILRRERRINKIVLSGGVFQNNLLLRLAEDLLYKEGFKVFTHKKLSCNDSGISLGQVAIAGFGS